MRDTLDHLPQAKQRELAHVVRVLFEEFEAATASTTTKWKKQARILKLVLYGSYARGDWVDDPIGGYTSDYDILVVVNDERLVDFELWSAADDRLVRETTIAKTLSAPISFIVHSLSDVNAQLERGRPFFIDIVRQGIALYEAEGFCFTSPCELPPDEARAEAQAYFDRWLPSAEAFAASAGFLVERSNFNEAAFNYHQAVERLYHCLLLVLTLYSPKSHRLNFLRSQAEQLVPELATVWPRKHRFPRRCFELLRQAYVNARYSPHYEITAEELSWISQQVAMLEDLVRAACERRLQD
ncbi:HEPN domain-containing protein [uncultured Sphingomonas sp.]|uniref:HEPN domain-containing protein n=1 Tax=uncultured Sphingomonas sp. TaxID=158754 RepID=UPI0025D5115A|nr:HEPN domain-containing protein [uncultured Sphingomonas sp.]